MIIKDNKNLGRQIKEMSNGSEFMYDAGFMVYNCCKINDKYVASETSTGKMFIFDVLEDCLSTGSKNLLTNYDAIRMMSKGGLVNR